MFDLVADVEQYPKFLPLCDGLTVRKREQRGRYRGADRRYVRRLSRHTRRLHQPRRARPRPPRRQSGQRAGIPERTVPQCGEPLDASPRRAGGCDVEFFIAYEFKSLVLQMLVGSLFDRVFRRYTEAFEKRAHEVYRGASA